MLHALKFTQSCSNEVPRKTKNVDPGAGEESRGDVGNQSAASDRSSITAKGGGRPEDPPAST